MRQGRGQRRGYGNIRKWFSGSQVCVCPRCGYTIPHISGRPCRALNCPYCQTPLLRNGELQQNNNNHKTNSEENTKTETLKAKVMDFPKINLDSCIGCGRCIDTCPMDAISLVDGKAVIDLDKCANCHACESACPNDAIS